MTHNSVSIVTFHLMTGGVYLDQIGWTLDKPNGFLVHLPSRVESLGGNLVKSC